MRFEESSSFSSSQLDFVPRDRRSHSSRLVLAFCLIVLALLIFTVAPAISGTDYAHLGLAIFVAVLGVYTVLNAQRTLDLVMTTEYQNMMFSQALALGTSFCLFVRRDGTIVYADEGLRRLFGTGTTESKALEAVFKTGGVGTVDRERIMGAIYSNVAERLVFPITAPSGAQRHYVLTTEPLTRPSGFMMIRGREYRGERTGTQVMPDMLRTTSPEKLDHLLASTPVGHYTTDASGRIEYANQAFERIAGYATGGVVSANLTLASLLAQLNETPVSSDYMLSDFSGSAVIKNSRGELVSCVLSQTVTRDANGKVTGSAGTLMATSPLN